MKRISFFKALVFFMLAGAWSVQADGVTSGDQGSITVEIENQTPCFLFGGYQLSVGMRSGHFRFRVSTQDSGRADFEDTGIDSRSGVFRRSYDDGSFGVSVDYFLSKRFFTYASLASNRWLVQNKNTLATDHLRTLDTGLGLGFQYVIYKGLFVQLAAHVNVRERQSLVIEGEQYTVPGIDYSPGLRVGYRF
jgi:predicted porin